MKRFALVVLTVFTLPGCQSSQPGVGEAWMSGAEVRAKDEANCRSYGFKPGTDAFANCLMQQDAQRGEHHDSEWAAIQSRPRPSDVSMKAPQIAPPPAFRPSCWPPIACVN
jgi:hypothetical protein